MVIACISIYLDYIENICFDQMYSSNDNIFLLWNEEPDIFYNINIY